MKKYTVRYVHEVEITYDAIVEAENEQDAMKKLEEGIFISEEEVDYQGMWIKPQYAVLIKD